MAQFVAIVAALIAFATASVAGYMLHRFDAAVCHAAADPSLCRFALEAGKSADVARAQP